MTTSEIATLPGYEEFAPWLLVEKRGNVHVVSINRPEAFNAALLAWPNVVVHLNAPLPHGPAWRRRMCQRVAFRLDDPEPLVRLLRWRLNQP